MPDLFAPSAPMHRLVACLAVASIVVGCGIAAQSPTPTVLTGTPTAAGTATQPPATSGAPSPTDGETTGPTDTAEPTEPASPTAGPTPQPTIAGIVNWANWPLYIDIDEEGNYPSLVAFTELTGIEVNYQEAIGDNAEFFETIQPDLVANRSVGFDIITPSDWMVEKLIRLGHLQPLDKSLLPNFEANVQELFADPWYDPGNAYSIPYTSGIVGIGYNPTLTGREITSFDDLLDPEFNGQVGLFSEMRDTMCLAILANGVKCEDATLADAQAAQAELLAAAEAGQFEDFYGNEYYDALSNGNIALTMAWSGDISQMQLNDNPDVRFVVPEAGGLLYVDNMVLPKVIDHPADAYQLMNYWYDVEPATMLTEYIGYYSPVKGVRELINQHVQEYRDAGDDENADYYEQVARDSFPDQGQLENIFNYKQLTEEEETQWNDLFNEVVAGG